jgi:pyruvate/2-oxoglutarate/acetoin dehydrogenase E1 component
MQAADVLASEGIAAEVIDLVALHPIDRTTLAKSVQKTGRLVIVHPHDRSLANAALAVGLDEAFLFLESPLTRATDAPGPVAQAARDAVFY